MHKMLRDLRWRTTKLAMKYGDRLEDMDDQERERLIDNLAVYAAYFGLWHWRKRYYAKRGAPPWLLPALTGIGISLEQIRLSLQRTEKQQIRYRKARQAQ